MNGQTQQLARAWWYEDPARRHDLRYWTGTEWSEFVIDGPNRTPSIDPPTAGGVATSAVAGSIDTATRTSDDVQEETPLTASANGGAASTNGASATPDNGRAPSPPVEQNERKRSSKRRIVLLALLLVVVGALLAYALFGRSDDQVAAAPSPSNASSAESATWDATAPAAWQQAEAAALIAEKGRVDAINGSAAGNAELSNLGAGECDQGERQLEEARGSLLPVPQASALSDRDALVLESLLNGWIRVARQCAAGSEFTGAAEAARLDAALTQL